jgi:hypothetical protein
LSRMALELACALSQMVLHAHTHIRMHAHTHIRMHAHERPYTRVRERKDKRAIIDE